MEADRHPICAIILQLIVTGLLMLCFGWRRNRFGYLVSVGIEYFPISTNVKAKKKPVERPPPSPTSTNFILNSILKQCLD